MGQQRRVPNDSWAVGLGSIEIRWSRRIDGSSRDVSEKKWN